MRVLPSVFDGGPLCKLHLKNTSLGSKAKTQALCLGGIRQADATERLGLDWESKAAALVLLWRRGMTKVQFFPSILPG